MSKPKTTFPDPAAASVAGLEADVGNQPKNYLLEVASTLGRKITIDGKTYDFTGLGQADTTAKISDQMAQVLLDIQKSSSPQLIAQRLAELKAADPQGYQARQDLFDKIMADANSHPDRPISTELQKQIQDELAKGVGFNDDKQKQEVLNQVRGKQVRQGVFLGNSPASEEAKTVTQTGEALRSQREQQALGFLQSGVSPEDVEYRRIQQSLANLGAFQTGETPLAQFGQVSGASTVPNFGGVNTNTFNPNAAAQGLNQQMGYYNIANNYNQQQANPWLAGLSTGASALGTIYQGYQNLNQPKKI